MKAGLPSRRKVLSTFLAFLLHVTKEKNQIHFSEVAFKKTSFSSTYGTERLRFILGFILQQLDFTGFFLIPGLPAFRCSKTQLKLQWKKWREKNHRPLKTQGPFSSVSWNFRAKNYVSFRSNMFSFEYRVSSWVETISFVQKKCMKKSETFFSLPFGWVRRLRRRQGRRVLTWKSGRPRSSSSNRKPRYTNYRFLHSFIL